MKTPLDGLADTIEREIALGRGPARLSDDELSEVLVECGQCPYAVHGTDREAIVWRRLHALAVEVRDARAGVR